MESEELFVKRVMVAPSEHGQAATQFVTAALDSRLEAAPDIVFSPNDPKGRIVCIEIRLSVTPLSSLSLAQILRHKSVILAANPGAVFALATDAKLGAKLSAAATREGLTIIEVDRDNPQRLALDIKVLSIP